MATASNGGEKECSPTATPIKSLKSSTSTSAQDSTAVAAAATEINHEEGNILAIFTLSNFDALFKLGASRPLEMAGMYFL
jgi:hypothetical protein